MLDCRWPFRRALDRCTPTLCRPSSSDSRLQWRTLDRTGRCAGGQTVVGNGGVSVTEVARDSTAAYVITVIFVATLVRSTLGFGEALIAVPLLALRTPVGVAAPLAVLVSVVVAGAVVVQDWRGVHFRAAAG